MISAHQGHSVEGMKKTIPVLVMAGVLLTGCAEDADEAVEEAGVEATIDAPAESAPPVVGEDETSAAADGEAMAPEGVSQECFDAVAAAGDETNLEGFADDTEPLWPAFDACASVEEFGAATDSVSGVLGDQQPEQLLRDVCSSVEEVSGSTLCLEVDAA